MTQLIFFLLYFFSVILAFSWGKFYGFKKGMDEADKMMDYQIMKKWKKLNENRFD